MTVDEARDRFEIIRRAVLPDDDAPINEATTRFRLIDPILTEVLGWSRDACLMELPAGEGRLDYLVHDAGWPEAGTSWFIVEAKGRAIELVPRHIRSSHERLKLSGPVLKDTWKQIIDQQMSEYLGRYNPAFGLVTNGDQWIGFLGRLVQGDRAESHAVVFRSLEAIAEDFARFYEFFSYEHVGRQALTHLLAPEHTGGLIRSVGAPRVVGENPGLDFANRDDDLHRALHEAMKFAFRPIMRDDEALQQCFVESRESREADTRLQRLAQELQAHVADVTSYHGFVEGQIDGRPQADAELAMQLEGDGAIARIIGRPHAGKTVYLMRLYNRLGRKQVLPIWLDAEKLAPFDEARANQEALGQVRDGLFPDGALTPNDLKAVYPREWRQAQSIGHTEMAFAQEQLEREANHPLDALQRYLRFALINRQLLPCIIVDNIDDMADPAAAVRWVVAIHQRTFALTTIALHDETLWRLRGAGRDQLGDFSPEHFWLPRPKIREVLAKRCEYLRGLIERSPGETPRARTPIGRRGITWNFQPDTLVRTISAVLLDKEDVSTWIGEICNFDLHRVLDLCRDIVLSPHLRAEDLLRGQYTEGVPRHRIIKAIVAPRTEHFQDRESGHATNIFGQWFQDGWSPLLPLRILALLRAREDEETNRRNPQPGFIACTWIEEVFRRQVGIPTRLTRLALESLVERELATAHDPSDRKLGRSDARIQITPRGRLHLDWAVDEPVYVRMMGAVDNIADATVCARLRTLWTTFEHSRRGRGQEIERAERDFAACYVAYCLAQARRVAPLPDGDELEPVRSFEVRLAQAWPI